MGGGPPFVKINGQYCPSNLYYQGLSALTIPQDKALYDYLPNKQISFEVDLNQLGGQLSILPHAVSRLSFRWSFYQDENFTKRVGGYQTGKIATYSFPRPGTYLVTVDAKMPTDAEYTMIDTVQLNIVPRTGYILPKAFVVIGTDFKKSTSVVFISRATVDKSTKKTLSFWDFGTGVPKEGVSLTHSFNNLTQLNAMTYVYNRVVDENGLSSDVGFNVEYRQNKLVFHPFGNMNDIPMRVSSLEEVQKVQEIKPQSFSFTPFVSIGVILLVIFFVVVIGMIVIGKKD